MGVSPLRIALVTETWPPETNGVAMTLGRLVEGLRERGHEVEVVRPGRPGEVRGAGGEGGWPVRPDVLRPGIALPLYPDVRVGWPSRGFLTHRWRRRRPHVVHLATEGPLGWSALRAAERLRLPRCSSFHTNFHAYSRHYGLAWLAGWVEAQLTAFHKRCAATLAPSAEVAARLTAAGVPGVRVLARGVDTVRFAPERRSRALRASWGLAPGDVALVLTGRLAAEKNLGLALDALAAVRAGRPGARLVLVGDGPWRARLEGREGVHMLGALPHGQVGAPLASGDVFVFPSLTETFGNVLLEALSTGLPSVSFRYAASAQHVRDGVNGLSVERGDDAGFVAAVRRLADDAGLRQRLGTCARETALTVGWAPVVDLFEQALAEVAAQDTARRQAS